MRSPKFGPPEEPGRLLEGSGEGGEPLRTLLRSAAADEPRGDQLERLASRLEGVLGGGTEDVATEERPDQEQAAQETPGDAAEGAVQGIGQTGTTLTGVKAAVWVGVAVAVGASAWAVLQGPEAQTQHAKPPAVAPVEPPRPRGEPPGVEAAETTGAAPNGPAEPRREPQNPVTAQAAPSPEGAPAEPAAAPSALERVEPEVSLLSRAQGALGRRDGAAALAVVSEHQKTYPGGVYEEEMQRIRIEALLLLGRSSEAAALAGRFFERFPRSVHRQRIEAMFGTAKER